ncbi:hypothetical protein ABBQ32_010201 [Trebouxia sp. C0010 RCD-2024]
MSKALEAKHDKILKGLLRQPDNKRCINCETLGPQYVVAELQIFVCTVCSGVHRQFSHRVKGLSTSTFKPEEIRALEAGGNRVGAYTYLAKWSPSELQKPLDRNTSKIKDWIDAVYVKKRFYSAEAASSAMHLPPVLQSQLPRRSISSNASSAGDDVPVMSMAGLLGDVKLKVDPNHFVSNAPNGLRQRATSTASSHSQSSQAPSHVSHQLFNILDEPLAEPGPTPLQEAPPSADWDAFGAPAPAAASGPASPSTTSWSAFDHAAPAVTAAHVTSHHQLPQPQQVVQSQQHLQQQSQHHLQRPPVQQQQQAAADTGGSWAVFGDSNSQAQQFQQPLQAQPEVMALQQQLKQQQQQQQPHAPEPVAAPPPKPAPRQELPLDLFGDGLLSSYALPASNASMYGHQRAHTQPGVYQQPQPHPQPGFQYGQPTGAGQLASGYLQAQPGGPPVLPHGASVSGYAGPPSAGLAFDRPVRQRSHSDNSGIGHVNSAPDPFSSLGGLAGTLPSQPVSRQASGSSMYSGHDTSACPPWSPTPAASQPFGQLAQPGSSASQAGNNATNSAFSGSNYAAPAQHQAPGPSRPPARSSGNPFA